MIPASFVAQVMKASYHEKDGWAEMIMPDGKAIQIARGCIGCTVNDQVRSMLCEPVERDGRLYLSIEWFCKDILNWQVSTLKDVMYATDHYSLLSINMARLIKDMLKQDGEIIDQLIAKCGNCDNFSYHCGGFLSGTCAGSAWSEGIYSNDMKNFVTDIVLQLLIIDNK